MLDSISSNKQKEVRDLCEKLNVLCDEKPISTTLMAIQVFVNGVLEHVPYEKRMMLGSGIIAGIACNMTEDSQNMINDMEEEDK